MNSHRTITELFRLLESPGLRAEIASSPAVRKALQGMLDQVTDEIAALAPLLAHHDPAERDRLRESLEGREEIAQKLREILETGHHAVQSHSASDQSDIARP